MSAFLLDNELADDLSSSTKYSEQWHQPFPEYERLAANLSSPNLPAQYDKVTDGTLSALMYETAMRIWGQLQTGRAVQLPTDNQDYPEWKTELVNVIWANRIIKNANTTAPFFRKLRIAHHKAFTYGSQPLFVFPVDTSYYTGADFILPPIRDVLIPSGYVSDLDAPRIWMKRHYDKLQLRGVIEAAKKVPDHNGWDIARLEAIYNSNAFTQKTEGLTYEQEDKATLGEKVTFATCYHRGYGAPFITIYPDGDNDNYNIVRREENKITTGDIPIVFIYNIQNLVNPYGVSQVELAGPSQNMVDLMTAGHSYALRQAVDPPLKVSGDTVNDQSLDLDSLVMSPGNLMFTGGAQVDWFTPDKGVLNVFPEQISSYKTNVMNLQGTSDGTSSAVSSGSSAYSKTHAGIQLQQERTNAKDNFHRQNADDAVAQLARVMINMTIQLTEGSEVIRITEEQRDKLVAAGAEVPEGKLQIIAEFEELKMGEFEFEVDAGTSKLEEDEATKQSVTDAIEVTTNIQDLDARLAKEGKKFNLGALLANYYDKSGIDNVDKIITELTPEEQQAQKDQELAQQEQAGAAVDEIRAQREQEKLAQEQMHTQEVAAKTAAAVVPGEEVQPIEPEQRPVNDDELVAAGLRANGWSDEDISEYLQRERSV